MMYDFIWNITLICPWECELCCTSAVYVKRKSSIIASSKEANSEEANKLLSRFSEKYPDITPNTFDISLLKRQLQGLEPTYDEKLKILKNLPKNSVIDFAGGDPLSCYENFLVIKEAAIIFGRENISITSTGHSLSRYKIKDIAKYIGEFEFTYDEFQPKHSVRPKGYNNSNIKVAKEFSNLGVRTKAQIPININNSDPHSIKDIYSQLDSCNIDEILLMRTFPVGRSSTYIPNKTINKNDIQEIISTYRRAEKVGKTKVRLQCALKHLDNNSEEKNPCDLMQDSFGINFQGKLLISAWGNGKDGYPISDDFILGNIIEESFSEISKKDKFKNYKEKLDMNWGHCKVFSYLFGNKKQSSLFTNTDPLYVSKTT